jgi:hypothetical protein
MKTHKKNEFLKKFLCKRPSSNELGKQKKMGISGNFLFLFANKKAIP